MEIQRTKTVVVQPAADSFHSFDIAGDFQERLNSLLAENAKIAKEKALFRNLSEKTEAEMMRRPINTKNAFAYFGLFLGIFPPAAFFLKFLTQVGRIETGVVLLLLFVNLICAAVGFGAGKIIGNIVRELEKQSWNLMLVSLPFIGMLWGIITGGAGGIFIFVFGAVFGAVIASIVGAVSFPLFTVFHRLLKKGDLIERKQFLPIACGIPFVIFALILGW